MADLVIGRGRRVLPVPGLLTEEHARAAGGVITCQVRLPHLIGGPTRVIVIREVAGESQLIVRLAPELGKEAALIYSSSVSKIGTFVGACHILNAFFIVHIDSPEAGAHSQITGRIK